MRLPSDLTVAGAGDERVLGITAVFDRKRGSLIPAFPPRRSRSFFQLLPVGRVGEHEVELARRKSVVGERRVFRPESRRQLRVQVLEVSDDGDKSLFVFDEAELHRGDEDRLADPCSAKSRSSVDCVV